jgi:hypothetical protein
LQEQGPAAKRKKRSAAQAAANRIASGAQDAGVDDTSSTSGNSSGATGVATGSDSDADSGDEQGKKKAAQKSGTLTSVECAQKVPFTSNMSRFRRLQRWFQTSCSTFCHKVAISQAHVISVVCE